MIFQYDDEHMVEMLWRRCGSGSRGCVLCKAENRDGRRKNCFSCESAAVPAQSGIYPPSSKSLAVLRLRRLPSLKGCTLLPSNCRGGGIEKEFDRRAFEGGNATCPARRAADRSCSAGCKPRTDRPRSPWRNVADSGGEEALDQPVCVRFLIPSLSINRSCHLQTIWFCVIPVMVFSEMPGWYRS